MLLFDKIKENQSFCVIPSGFQNFNFLKFYFVYEILKLRLETLSLEVLVKGRYKMHFIFKGVRALCLVKPQICSLRSIF